MIDVFEILFWILAPQPSYRWVGRRLFQSEFVEDRRLAPWRQKLAIYVVLLVAISLAVGLMLGLAFLSGWVIT